MTFQIKLFFLGMMFLNYFCFAGEYFSILKTDAKNGIFKMNTIKDHHFNLNAPLKVKSDSKKEKISSSLPKELIIKAPGASYIQVDAFICDDKKSFCKKSTESWGNVIVKPKKNTTQSIQKKNSNFDNYKDFILNDPKLAFEKAKLNHKLVMIDFFGIWCPPCNMLDAQVFSSKTFKQNTQDWIKLKLDADSEISWELKSKYSVGGYPTIIFTNANGVELNRIVGFKKITEFLTELKKAKTNQEIINKGKNLNSETLGLIAFEKNDFKKSLHYFEDCNCQPDKTLISKLELLKESDIKEEEKINQSIALIEPFFLIKNFSIENFSAILTLAESYHAKKISKFSLVYKNLEEWLDDLKTFDVLKSTELLAELAQSVEEKISKGESLHIWEKCKKGYQEALISSKSNPSIERGINLELAYVYRKLDKHEQAKVIYTQLENTYPKEFTFYFAHSKMLLELKDFRQALDKIQKAFLYSYGDNKLRTALTYGEILFALNKMEEAKILIKNVLSEFPNSPDREKTHSKRYLNQLKDFLKKLEA